MGELVELSLADTLTANAVRFRNVAAYVDRGSTVTHSELLVRAEAIASALADRGIRHQDRIAVLSRNRIEFGEVLAAAHLAGFVAATVNFRLSAREIGLILHDSAPRVLFFEAEYLPVVRELAGELTAIDLYVCFDPEDGGIGAVPFPDLLAEGAGRQAPFRATADDIACLIYTSGTTGVPKGCVLGQRELRWVGAVMNNEMRTGSDDRILLVMPIFHIGAMAMALGIHARGGTAVLRSSFEPEYYADDVRRSAITVLHLAPTMLGAVLDSLDGNADALEAVRTVVYSAAPITATTLQRALGVMPGAGFLNLYGQTEVITSGLPRELHLTDDERSRRRLKSVGYPFPNTQVNIIDDVGNVAAPGISGEIAVHSPGGFRGYWNRSAATAETIQNGWVHTGDIGVIDDEGLLYLLDRKKDVIVSGGENITSLEVEDAVAMHPAVSECAVIGVKDVKWGEKVCAVVVLRDGHALDVEVLRDHVAEQIARFKAPRALVIVDAIPKLSTGKIDKKALRAQYDSGVP